jgi:hypothetical protein
MPMIGNIDVGSFIPAMSMPSFSPLTMIGITFGLLVAVGFVLFFRMSRYRILVEILEYINKGFVSKKGRYRQTMDKSNNMIYLQPMSGNLRIANFPANSFTKTFGLPMIGVKRTISVIRINQHTFNVFLPPEGNENVGQQKAYDTRSWLHAEQVRKANKALKASNTLNLIMILTPTFVLLTLVALLLIGLFMPITFFQYLTKKADAITNALLEVAKKKWGV